LPLLDLLILLVYAYLYTLNASCNPDSFRSQLCASAILFLKSWRIFF